MGNPMLEMQTIEDTADLDPSGNDGVYGHAYIGLRHIHAGANELSQDGIVTDQEKEHIIEKAVDVFIRKFGSNLKEEGAMDNFDPAIRDAILARLASF